MKRRLRSVTIKPVSACPLACPYCSRRRGLLSKPTSRPHLELHEWQEVVRDAAQLGATRIDISGGEPSLYPHLYELVAECRTHMVSSINTNGYGVSPEMASELHRLGLDNISISIMSLVAAKHDDIRGRRGSHVRAVTAIRACTQAGIHTTVHFILARQNYRELPSLIQFLHQHDVRALVLAYPENDAKEHYLLMGREDIEVFRTRVVPQAREAFHACFGYDVGPRLAGLFREPPGCDFSAGLYATRQTVCEVPRRFVLIYPDGSVLPCNAVEYTHSPIVGNVRDSSLAAIWNGEEFSAFRAASYAFCRSCPLPHIFYHRI